MIRFSLCLQIAVVNLLSPLGGASLTLREAAFAQGEYANYGTLQEIVPTTILISDATFYFEMARYECTIMEFCNFLNSSTEVVSIKEAKPEFLTSIGLKRVGDAFTPIKGYAKFPITRVNWYDASAYCKWLSGQLGQHYRLPEYIEWEYAARGPNKLSYPWGNDPALKVKRIMTPDLMPENRIGDWVCEVGSFPDDCSIFGIFDMLGNAAEWCNDSCKVTITDDGQGAADGKSRLYKIVKGCNKSYRGSFPKFLLGTATRFSPESFDFSATFCVDAESDDYNQGFRVVIGRDPSSRQ